MKQIILLTLIGILLAGGFYLNRQIEVKRLQSELTSLQTEKLALQQGAIAAAEMEKTYAATVDVAAFTEALYGSARDCGIRDHEVTTNRQRAEQQPRRGRSRRQQNTLKTHRLQVDLSGSFKQIAEYIAQIQKLEAYKKIATLELLPGEKKLGATISIDLYSLEAPHVR